MKKRAHYYQVTQGVWGMKMLFVNIYMIANRKGIANGWVLVDAGLKGYTSDIISMAEALFGEGTKPEAIILTHGHFDHTGCLLPLLEHWDVPVYAHKMELPYLTGRSSYPPPDPTVGGGLMAWMAWSYPVTPIDLGDKVHALDDGGQIDELPEWKWIYTPGHSPGHISLFFALNSTLIAGDAFVTTKNESAIYALSFIKRLSGPPKYLTTDWAAAAQSVRKLYALQPRTVATGHGYPMRGRMLTKQFKKLVDNFEETAIPAHGRYVRVPATADENGTDYVPPSMASVPLNVAVATIAVLALGFLVYTQTRKKRLL
jgi:glyoxylase-like metal-dependent hydrolase (beta-lactamase superfamily II)